MKYAIPVLFILCTPAIGADLAPEQRRAIQEFQYGGLGFATSRLDFLKKFPGTPESIGAIPSWRSYTIPDESGTTSHVRLDFLDDKLMMMSLFYLPEKVEQHGGAGELHARAVDRFGDEFKRDADGNPVWTFKDMDRFVTAGKNSTGWALVVGQVSLAKELEARLEALKVGF